MIKDAMMAGAVAAFLGTRVFAESPPEALLTNGVIRARLHLPDSKTGFYRGTRFDWSGVIGGLEYAGHEFYPMWFQRVDPKVHDFTYDGRDIVAGPCTAITGPPEEFVSNGKGLGFDEAKPGGTFIKIGVGVLRRPDDRAYDPYHLYEIADGGRWTVRQSPGAIEFAQELADPSSGYSYEYHKTVALTHDQPRLSLVHSLRNTGKRAIRTSVYNHNFLHLDHQPPGPDFSVKFPFALQPSPVPDTHLVTLAGNQFQFAKTLVAEDRVYFTIKGFGQEPKDNDIRIENRRLGVGVRFTSDRPLSKVAFWSIRAPLCVEPFIDISIEPGAEFTWRTDYEYYRLP